MGSRVVLDANVLISAAFGGTPLDAVARAFSAGEVCVSPRIDAEIRITVARLERKLGGERAKTTFALWERLRSRCVLVEEVQAVSICRDPKDDAYLALCVAAGADFLVTGDRYLLETNRPRRLNCRRR